MIVLQILAGLAMAVVGFGGGPRLEAHAVRLGYPATAARWARYAIWAWAAFTLIGTAILVVKAAIEVLPG